LSFIIDIQVALDEPEPELPDNDYIKNILETTLKKFKKTAECCVRIVSNTEIITLNKRYRQKDKPTNVLSFPAELPEGLELDHELLGDIVIASNVVKQEAIEQSKSYKAHFTHMLVHGALHLLGFDHIKDQDAKIMEQQEINIMQELDFASPYPHIN